MNLSKALNIVGVTFFLFGLLLVIIGGVLRTRINSDLLCFGIVFIALSLLVGLFKQVRRFLRRRKKSKHKRKVRRIPYEAETLVPIFENEGYKTSKPFSPEKERSFDDCIKYQTYIMSPKSDKKKRCSKQRNKKRLS